VKGRGIESGDYHKVIEERGMRGGVEGEGGDI
jgi:hypothetical protein